MKPFISDYAFGSMTAGGRAFTSDLIIFPDRRIQSDWWRAQGHGLVPSDLSSLLDEAFDLLVIGTGAHGLMRVSEELIEECKKRGIGVEARPTAEAMTRFNEAAASGTAVAACFHLTC